jgi:heterodisulfide reductase subunit A
MCAASCPSHAAELSGFSDRLLLAEAREAFREATPGEPRILELLCYWCGYGGVDMAGILRLEAPTCVRPVRIRCSSSVNTGLLFEMFRMGVDGVIVAGCPHNSCHHMWGNWLADKRVSLARQLMQQMGLDEKRLVFENIGLVHGPRFVELVQQKREELLALGPNPLAQQQTLVEGARPTWQAR